LTTAGGSAAPRTTPLSVSPSECSVTVSRTAPLGRPAIVNGRPGVVVVDEDRVLAVAALTIVGTRVTQIDLLIDPVRLRDVRV
jgi:hypothetical protein